MYRVVRDHVYSIQMRTSSVLTGSRRFRSPELKFYIPYLCLKKRAQSGKYKYAPVIRSGKALTAINKTCFDSSTSRISELITIFFLSVVSVNDVTDIHENSCVATR